jgi:KaiC/GvpD/RAD55 family RecA-like ATPase
MPLPIDIPGLNTLVPNVPEGSLVVAESASDPAKSYFIQRICRTAHERNLPVTFVTSRDREEIIDLLDKRATYDEEEPGAIRITARDQLETLEGLADKPGILAIDSFSFLTLEIPTPRLAAMLRDLRAMCHRHGAIVILGTDRGMFDPRSEAVTIHLADGLFQFHVREGPETAVRYLRVPKWMDGRFIDRNIYYEFDGKRMVIDLRKRVI